MVHGRARWRGSASLRELGSRGRLVTDKGVAAGWSTRAEQLEAPCLRRYSAQPRPRVRRRGSAVYREAGCDGPSRWRRLLDDAAKAIVEVVHGGSTERLRDDADEAPRPVAIPTTAVNRQRGNLTVITDHERQISQRRWDAADGPHAARSTGTMLPCSRGHCRHRSRRPCTDQCALRPYQPQRRRRAAPMESSAAGRTHTRTSNLEANAHGSRGDVSDGASTERRRCA